MSDSANKDYFSWLRSVTADPAAGDNGAAGDATPDDNPLPFAAPGGMPIFPRYGTNGADGAPASLSPPAMEPTAAAPPALTVSDLPTARISAAPLPTPAAPSVSDLPTTHLTGARVSSAPAPSPAQDVSDLPTQRVKATLPPATASAPPASTPSRSAVRPRARIVVVAATIVALLVVVSAALALTALRPAAATTNAAYRQPLTAVAEGWPNSGACRFTASGYEVSGPSVCFYGGQDVRDATISVTMTRTSEGNEPSAGLAFRRTGAAAFYTFELDGNGDWAVYKRGTVLQQGDNDAIKTDQGAKNTLRVQMKGGHFTFAVNGAQVAQLDDAEFATGEVGLTGYTGLKVVYTDLTIAPLS